MKKSLPRIPQPGSTQEAGHNQPLTSIEHGDRSQNRDRVGDNRRDGRTSQLHARKTELAENQQRIKDNIDQRG